MFLRRRRQLRADVLLSVSLINVKDCARQGSLCSSQTEHDSSSLFLIEELGPFSQLFFLFNASLVNTFFFLIPNFLTIV